MSDRWQLGLTRIDDFDPEHRMPDPQGAERPLPAPLLAEIGDHDHEPRLTGDPAHSSQGARHALGVVLAIGRDALGKHPAQRDHPGLGAARRQHPRRVGTERDKPDAPRPADAEPAEHERDAFGHIGLQAQRRAKRHRRRDVEHDPRRERALGHVHAHVRLAGARGGSGIDVAHVIANLVGAQLGELGPGADPGRPPVARQHPRDQAAERYVERLDQRLRQRTRALPGRGRLQTCRAHPALATVGASWIRWSAPGSGTAASTRSRTSSAVTPSLRAS